MVEVKQVTRYFGRVMAVDNVSFQVGKGEIVGFLGPNAAGKTTTMRILTTYLPATSGTAVVAGFDVHEHSMEVRRRIGYLPENPPLYMDMRVTDYLEFVAKIKGIDGRDRKRAIAETMDKTGISSVSGRVIKQLSKGYKQRVGLAQALVHNPEVLILDEPTVGLDPKQIIEVRELIKGLAGTHTIILSTHILPEVSMTCERVVIIDKGKIVAEDTPENLTRKLAGSQRFALASSGPAAEVQNLLGRLEGVRQVRALDLSAPQGIRHYQIESGAEGDISPAIARAIIEKGWDLYELRPEGLSLEDVFLRVTTTEEEVDHK
ncbi:MAG TPA: ATP-binding cassette domain-containing protein [bacterium]|nr:ATP-binding cassette domain-containing protein [bacterium]HQG46424.1 ATP-binding cassette domain-containing protein [bacterium]HQI48201.1 ATP-binding cassette domain-containing protein [bacterium]HQJ64773.1 ATP-binding cassette domain-containing protein [bacterium]